MRLRVYGKRRRLFSRPMLPFSRGQQQRARIGDRAQLCDCLKLWEPEFSTVIKKKRRVALKDDVQAVVLDMQVDPALL